jgi:hypothetical protein
MDFKHKLVKFIYDGDNVLLILCLEARCWFVASAHGSGLKSPEMTAPHCTTPQWPIEFFSSPVVCSGRLKGHLEGRYVGTLHQCTSLYTLDCVV